MAELMLVNPRRKKRRGTKRRKMSALQLQYFGKRRKRRTRRRAVAAARPVRRHRRRSAALAAPVRRRRTRRHRRTVTRLRRNPMRLGSFSPKRFLSDTLIPASVGAAGALGVDLALGYGASYLPASMQTGMMRNVAKLIGAVGVGYVAGMIGGKRFGEQATAGAVTVTLYDLFKTQIKSAVPSLPLSGGSYMGWISPAIQVGSYVGTDNAYSGMNAYVGAYESGDGAYYAYNN